MLESIGMREVLHYGGAQKTSEGIALIIFVKIKVFGKC